MIDRRWDSSVLDVRSFWGADCDSDHCLVVANVREKFAVSKQAAQKFDGERFYLRMLSDLEFRKQYQIKISNTFVDMENLSDNEEIIRVWENITTPANDSLGLMN